jgi:hypothetical protein
MKPDHPDRLFEIYLALDEAYLHNSVPSQKLYGQVADFIDHLRSNNSASKFLPLAETILVTIHRLQPALGRESKSSDMGGSRYKLKKLCDDWLMACPLHAANSELGFRNAVVAS